MTQDDPIRVVGVPGSPYSRKLRAVLRYRRIPHVWVTQGAPESRDLPRPKVELLPQMIVRGADGALQALTDTTPLIRRLEGSYAGRSVIPPDPAVAFLDALIEDYADEWLTKAMFHYRWAYANDIANAAAILPRWFRTDGPDAVAVEAGKTFSERQIGRLGVVGSNETTTPVIEASYHRLLRLLDARLATSRFVLGPRPAACDFGLYGQLTQLTGFDPTPSGIARRIAPRVVAWVDVVEDLSGIEPGEDAWAPPPEVVRGVRPLLEEIGRVYAPFLLANAEALERRADLVRCTIDGLPWEQRPFPYQGKCLGWLREAHAALGDEPRRVVDHALAGTGCDALFGRHA